MSARRRTFTPNRQTWSQPDGTCHRYTDGRSTCARPAEDGERFCRRHRTKPVPGELVPGEQALVFARCGAVHVSPGGMRWVCVATPHTRGHGRGRTTHYLQRAFGPDELSA